ncbi:hypothetical protein [Streptantibioticus ferralitis]|uniref:Uncharacterized protein n=1 Tax=Streptantibioticus ferralitis TaxID=236510 RepID=A0ABT5Z8A7_9ACTN|nr:hypothetical protein [Streptantibioticus ferralitis]MDF2260065.1 hypothetical protein [Streptantibioticus ferralitis]
MYRCCQLSCLRLIGGHVTAALGEGWTLVETREAVVGDAWAARKPKGERSGVPVCAAYG